MLSESVVFLVQVGQNDVVVSLPVAGTLLNADVVECMDSRIVVSIRMRPTFEKSSLLRPVRFGQSTKPLAFRAGLRV